MIRASTAPFALSAGQLVAGNSQLVEVCDRGLTGSALPDGSVQSPEDHFVDRQEYPPVQAPGKTARTKQRRGTQARGSLWVSQGFELQVGFSRYFHPGLQAETSARLDFIHSPEVQLVTGLQVVGIAAALSHAHAADDSVQQRSQAPNRGRVVPAATTADSLHHLEHLRWRRSHSAFANVGYPPFMLHELPAK